MFCLYEKVLNKTEAKKMIILINALSRKNSIVNWKPASLRSYRKVDKIDAFIVSFRLFVCGCLLVEKYNTAEELQQKTLINEQFV